MANENLPLGFKQAAGSEYTGAYDCRVAASETFEPGDLVFMDSSGYITLTASTNPMAGIVAGRIMDGTTGLAKTTSGSAGVDRVKVWDPRGTFVGQVTTGAATDPYTHYTASSMYDVAGTTGVQYINASASSLDQVQIMGPADERNGSISQVGSYQKVVFRLNQAKIVPLHSTAIKNKFV